MQKPQKFTCDYHQRTKQRSQDDDSIEFDDESSKSEEEEEEEEFQFDDSMEREEYNVEQNRKLFKNVKEKVKITRKHKKDVVRHVLKRNATLSLKEQEEVLERLLVKQKNQVLSRVEKSVLKKICKKGLDERYRRHLWFRASGAAAALNLQDNRGYYRKLKNTQLEYPNPSFYQIELDLRRTFTELKIGKGQERLINKLRNVLTTYCKRNPTIGYCQGMNFLVGRLLKVIQAYSDTFNL